MGRAQVSLEYLVIVGIAIGILVPGVMLFYSYNKSTVANSVAVQLSEIGLEVVSTAKTTYGMGRNARQTLQFNMPEGVVSMRVDGPDDQEIVFTYETELGRSEAMFVSSVPVVLHNTTDNEIVNVRSGITKLRFQSLGSRVNITEDYS